VNNDSSSCRCLPQFDHLVITIEQSADTLSSTLEEAFGAVTDTITAHAQTSAATWPFVTVPFFVHHGHHALESSSGVNYFSYCPLVKPEQRSAWESYAIGNSWWLEEDGDTDQTEALTEAEQQVIVANETAALIVHPDIYQMNNASGDITTELSGELYCPHWQAVPVPQDTSVVNFDVLSEPILQDLFQAMVATNGPVISRTLFDSQELEMSFAVAMESNNNTTTSLSTENTTGPQSYLMYPIYETFEYDAAQIVGLVEIPLNWLAVLRDLLPPEEFGLFYVLNNTCGDLHTYELRKPEEGGLVYLGEGDEHNRLYEREAATVPIHPMSAHGQDVVFDCACSYEITIYPSYALRQQHGSNIPELFTAVIAGAFFLMAFTFFAYDKFVRIRNDKVLEQAAKTNAIVSSLFPSNVRDRLFGGGDDGSKGSGRKSIRSSFAGRSRLKNYLSDTGKGDGEDDKEDKPIADLFPNCTVLFADIVGFTAWSSMREPTQVFTLLESVYHAFDEIAKRRKVFKVETIGDCYVAVTGLPGEYK